MIADQEKEEIEVKEREVKTLKEELKLQKLYLSILEYYQKNIYKIILVAALIGGGVAIASGLSLSLISKISGEQIPFIFGSLMLGGVAGSVWYSNFTSKMREINSTKTEESFVEKINNSEELLKEKEKSLEISNSIYEFYFKESNRHSDILLSLREYKEIVSARFRCVDEYAENIEEINNIYYDDPEITEVLTLVREKVENQPEIII